MPEPKARGYVEREVQQRMAHGVALASTSNVPSCRGGTGVGKTFAYLLPTLLSATVLGDTDTKRLPDSLCVTCRAA